MQVNLLNNYKKNVKIYGEFLDSPYFFINFALKQENMIKLFKTYNKAKDVFVRPKLKFQFGLWRNTYGLPVWRSAGYISLANRKQYYIPEKSLIIRTDDSYSYRRLYHKLPKGCENGVWRRDIRKKLNKWGLGWLKPRYQLPLWLSFYIFNWDVCYKWKYDDIRYEFPPQFTIVFFGLAFTILAIPEAEDDDDCPDHYWESLLSYLYQDECERSIEKTLNYCGQWTRHDKNTGERKYFQLRKSHLKVKFHDEYDEAINKWFAKNLDKNSLC